jgi:2-methylisocitrate lyase-like PEP mutase family enzyme
MSRAEQFRLLHQAPPLLVLPNAWDVASARVFAALPGCRAIATSSAAVARSLGWEDGEQAPVEEMLQVVERIAAAVDVPVTADLEAGYGDPPRTAVAALAADQVEIIRAVRAAAPELVLNARVDVFLVGDGDLDEAIDRGNAYLAAGAGCVYPIAAPFDLVGALAAGIDGPVNVLVSPRDPPIAELARLGVARVTFGAGLATVALEEASRLTAAAISSGV